MNIAITGATGFLGKYLVSACHKIPEFIVRVIARPQENAGSFFGDSIKISETDYTMESLTETLQGVDCLIHLAAQTMQRDTDPMSVSTFIPVNVVLTENLLKSAAQAGVKKIIQMSSNNVYSNQNHIPFSETEEPKTSTVYGLSKIYAEQLGQFFARKTGLNIISLRLARLYGYGERDSVVFTRFMKLAMNNKSLEIWGKGNTSIEYLYVRDCVEAIIEAVHAKIPSGVYNLGSSQSYSVLQLAQSINEICGNQGNIVQDLSKQETGNDILMDSSLFEKYTHWKARWSLENALQEMTELFRDDSKIKG